MSQKKLSGTGVALATPFNSEGKVDYTSLEKLINHVITGGVDYLVVLGTTGETSVLSGVEKKEVTKFVKGYNSGRLPIVLGIGGNHTAAVVEEIKNTDLNGIDAILSVAPYYNKPSQEGLYQHFSHIANASPLPVIIYNVPGRTSSNI
jgi:4-hydroxy-tetrahydrodipicolinate synthase